MPMRGAQRWHTSREPLEVCRGSVEIEAEAPSQDADAVGTFRRIRLKYRDGCEIVLDGQDRDKSAAFLEGPDGKIFKGMKSDIANFEKKARRVEGA